ncbi:MAG: hypothetical protein R3Y26_09365 [Rikenellaceae bacterium]
MISKLKEQLSIIDLIIDSVEDNGGFTNLDKKAALDAVRNIYDTVLTSPTINIIPKKENPAIEVSVYGISDTDDIEIELDRFETVHLNDDCTFEIENTHIGTTEDSKEEVITENSQEEEEEEEDYKEDESEEDEIVVEEFYLNSEGDIAKEKIDITFNETTDDYKTKVEQSPIQEEEEEEEEEEDNDPIFEIEQNTECETGQTNTQEAEQSFTEEVRLNQEGSQENESDETDDSYEDDVKFIIGEIMDDDSTDDLNIDCNDTEPISNEDKIVYTNDNEFFEKDEDLNFSETEKARITSELFEGNVSDYNEFIIRISQFTDFDEAIIYLQETFSSQQSNEETLSIIAEKLATKIM